MRLLFVSGSRGEWGYIRPIVRLCQARGVDYSICATNMLLLTSHGVLVDEITADGFEVSDRIYMSLEGHNRITMAKSLGVFMSSFVDVLARREPDWLVLAGDRGEQLVAAMAGAYTYVPTAHIQAGERSGNIDGVARHAIGKLAHLHFAANDDAAERLRRLGEDKFRVHTVGAPQLDELSEGCAASPEELKDSFSIDVSSGPLLVILHPVTEEFEHADTHIRVTAEALKAFDRLKIWILPNNDAGADRTRRGLLRHRGADVHIFENLSRRDFLGFLKASSCIVGNSSAGLLEAPTFSVPAVNLGRRQADRVQGDNVLNADFETAEIVETVQRAVDPSFRAGLSGTNPYGDGRSAERILDVLANTPKDDRLLVKRLTY